MNSTYSGDRPVSDVVSMALHAVGEHSFYTESLTFNDSARHQVHVYLPPRWLDLLFWERRERRIRESILQSLAGLRVTVAFEIQRGYPACLR